MSLEDVKNFTFLFLGIWITLQETKKAPTYKEIC